MALTTNPSALITKAAIFPFLTYVVVSATSRRQRSRPRLLYQPSYLLLTEVSHLNIKMPKHSKKDSSDSDSDSGPEDRAPPPKKSKSGGGDGAAKTNDSGESYFDIDGLRRVTVREFKGRVYVDIREFYEKDGKVLPGKKGISLSTSQWGKVKSLMDSIDGAVEQLR
ncbi:RNA polymerase II transcriptional coactivator-like isoform X2 [Macrobrachium nipponense]|uniref:RNA polymerase II transcriptional coactivator-like isoform X2 n=1 Tax=Macrobrachium nipponense TaxID=159736 RepID=UPI0030C8CE9D